jgi:hypothetical protein
MEPLLPTWHLTKNGPNARLGGHLSQNAGAMASRIAVFAGAYVPLVAGMMPFAH